MASPPVFSPLDVCRVFGLKDRESVEELIRAGTLEISAFSKRGVPLFSRESVVRAAKRVLPRPEGETAAR